MKKIISFLLTGVFLLSLSACGTAESTAPSAAIGAQSQKLNVVCTIFPEYDWMRQILGARANETALTLLLDSGVDLHSYQPTADDMIRISTADVFVYVGGESDGWVEDALREATNPNLIAVNLMEALGGEVREEELVEGMQAEQETGAEEAEKEAPELDEHVWLSLRKAKALCGYFAQALAKADPAHANEYAANAAAYQKQLEALDAQYQAAADRSPHKTLLFADRFPFRYLADDYGLTYYAAFVGCSAETEASFETVRFLAGKVDALDLGCVLTIEGAKHQIAQTVIRNTEKKNQSILTLNSMQSVTAEDVAGGVTYLSLMEANLDVLRQALA